MDLKAFVKGVHREAEEDAGLDIPEVKRGR